MRYAVFPLLLLMLTSPAYAVDWKTLGRPLDDDTKRMEDRYVYFDDSTTDKNVGLDKPVLVIPDIQRWLSERIAEVLNLDGARYDQQIVVNRRHFTAKGYGEYVTSLQNADIPKLLKEQRYKMSAIVYDPPNVFANGLRNENEAVENAPEKLVYVWKTQVPVVVNYQNINGATRYKIYLTAELIRIPMQDDANHTLVAINGWQFSAKPRKSRP